MYGHNINLKRRHNDAKGFIVYHLYADSKKQEDHYFCMKDNLFGLG